MARIHKVISFRALTPLPATASDRRLDAMLSVVDGVPAVVRNKAVACGATQWLDELPALIASLEREWSIAVG